jgi:hypothetical protein
MKKIASFLFLLASCFKGESQNFQYLNASNGNPEFFTDSDTNMFMIHGNRIAKLNKSFNPVWVKTYGSITFKSILLTKTGSMYFIAGEYPHSPSTTIGKIEANGVISWMKSTSGMTISVAGSTVSSATINCNSIYMNSANNLLLAGAISGPGNALLAKMDTLGNLLMTRTFSLSTSYNERMWVSSMNILNESSGIINLVSLGGPDCLGCGNRVLLQTHLYSDLVDTVVFARESVLASSGYKCSSGLSFGFYRSKTRSDVYYVFGSAWASPSSGCSTSIPGQARLGKFTMSGDLWSRAYRWNRAYVTEERKFDEDERGNIFTVIDDRGSSNNGVYNSGIVKFDSSGNYNGKSTKYFNGYNGFLSYTLDERANVIHYNRTFLNVVGGGFPNDPVTTETITPGLTWACSAMDTVTKMGSWTAPFNTIAIPKQFKVTSMVMANLSPTIATVPGFSLSQNLCLYMNVEEQKQQEAGIIYPNPTRDKLFIKNINSEITAISLFNVTGTLMPVKMNNSELDLSDCPPGIYFLRIETDSGTMTKKIMKE